MEGDYTFDLHMHRYDSKHSGWGDWELRMRERCSDLAGLVLVLELELFVSGPGNIMGAYAWSSNRHK